MADEIAFENGRISNFQGLVTLTLNRVILHTIVHHSKTSTYISNFIETEKTFCGRTDVHTYVPTKVRMEGHLRPTLLGRLNRVYRKMETIDIPQRVSLVVNFWRSAIIAELWRPEVAIPGNFVSIFVFFFEKRPIMVKFSKFYSEILHGDTDRRCCVQMS